MTDLYRDVTGVVLVGGRSRRMGRDKALLPFGGRPLVSRPLEACRALFARTLLVGAPRPELCALGVPIVADEFPGSPLGGLLTALRHAGTPWIFALACDLPWPEPRLMVRLVELRGGYDVVVPRSARGYEPLCAVYGTGCLAPLEALRVAGNLRLFDLYPRVRTRVVPAAELADLVTPGRTFVNINTPEEFAMISTEAAQKTVKAVSFVAKSGTGKTTLLERVIAELKRRGYRVGAIKHDAHRFDIDHPGKDSYRFTAAGADTMLISSPEKLALVKRHAAAPPIEELLATYFGDVDIVLTEGFKLSGLPKIEVHRRERSATLLCRGEENDPTLLAVVSDEPLALDVPVLDLDEPRQVADFVEARFLR